MILATDLSSSCLPIKVFWNSIYYPLDILTKEPILEDLFEQVEQAY